ncbi:MAG: hypothetical protein MI864_14995 [Pseudomonadales bacterium]|nr:hypothetical protein [Pseudomonadales bacterium]
MIVTRLESSREFNDDFINALIALKYEVSQLSKKVIFAYRKDSESTKLTNDIKSAKSASNHTSSITCNYGTSKKSI